MVRACVLLLLCSSARALRSPLRRRAMMGAAAASAAAAPRPGLAYEAPPGFEPARVEGIGGGADMLADGPAADVPYPPFLNGSWLCERVVTSVEGDAFQAEGAWRLLGGTGSLRSPEAFQTRFIDTRQIGTNQPVVGLDGRKYFGVVLDRGAELDARARGASVRWDPQQPNVLSYERSAGGRGSAAELKVVQRSVEMPSESNKGWGSNELVRITTASDSVFGELKITYAARVQRRFRRALTESGDRVVEGLEVMKTYRVLDGVAGVEMPTSTTKSIIRLTRVK